MSIVDKCILSMNRWWNEDDGEKQTSFTHRSELHCESKYMEGKHNLIEIFKKLLIFLFLKTRSYIMSERTGRIRECCLNKTGRNISL